MSGDKSRAAELVLKKKQALQKIQKGKLAAALLVTKKALLIKTDLREKRTAVLVMARQAQESQYARSLIEASLDPLVTISVDGKILDVNEASVKVTGTPRAKLIGTNFSNYFTEPEKAQKGYLQAFEKGFVSDYALTIKHVNGKLTDVLYNASVYKDEKGKVLGLFAAARDVTEQKQASQYSRSLIEASLDPLVTISGDGKILDVNEASVKVTGTSRAKLIGTNFSNYFTEPEKAQKGYLQAFEKGFVSDYALTIKHVNGKLTDVLYNASVYKDDSGNVLGVFAAARDVTEQKWAKDLRIANIELAFQNNEKEKRAAELIVANKELSFQNDEKEKRAAELSIANKELHFQNKEKEKRAEELSIANIELAFQNNEKEKRAAELIIANKELAFQNEEKEKRAAELIITNKELNLSEKSLLNSLKEVSDYKYSLDESAIIALTDQKGIIKKANRNFCEISKYTEEELIGQDHRIVSSGYHSKEFIRDLWVTIASGKIWKGEIKNIAKDGSFYWVDTTIVPFLNEQGKPYQYLAIRLDISKRKESEEQLNTVNKDLAFQNDEKGKRAAELDIANKELIFQNKEKEKRAAELSIANKELAFQSEEKEKRAAELIVANKELSFQNDEKEKRAAELSIANKELHFQNKEKEKRAEELGIANTELAFQNDEKEKRAAELIVANKELAFQNEEKEKRAAELIIANEELVFQNKEKESRAAELIIANRELIFQNEEKEKRAAELIIANKELVAFTYISSHDLQEPMRKIQTFAGRLLETEHQNLSETGQDYFKRMQSAANRMQLLLTDLLAFSRVNSGELKFETTDLKSLVEEVENDFKERIEAIHATFEIKQLGTATIVPIQFRQLIQNLLGNALKFSKPDKAPHIIVGSKIAKGSELSIEKMMTSQQTSLSPEKSYCHITFSDNGIGFEPEFKEQIFEVFQRLHSKSEYEGTGIGLAIVKKIVENHNGIITATSELDKGATFDIYIPN